MPLCQQFIRIIPSYGKPWLSKGCVVNMYLEKRYIRDRIDSSEGLSLAEFMYQILQAYDWKHLHKTYNCRFQIGGLDQLGNISAGHHLIRRLVR